MVDIGKIKIRKKIYKFEVKKRYQHVLHYRKKERAPIERIKDALKNVIGPKKQQKKTAIVHTQIQPPKGGFNFVVFGAAVLIAVIILALSWLYLSVLLQDMTAGAFQPPGDKPFIENSILHGEILSSGQFNSPEYRAGVLIDYTTENLQNYTIYVTPYDKKMPSEVFLLSTEKNFGANIYSDFVRDLRYRLSKRKMNLNEITVEELETIPQGAVVVVPSGTIPMEMLGYGSSISMDKLADRGVIVIYMGYDFTEMYNKTKGKKEFTPKEKLKELPVTFESGGTLTSTDEIHLFQPLYRAVGRSGWKSTTAYGSISIITKGNGGYIFLPQTLDGGWRENYTAAAEDVSKLIFQTPWATPIAETNSYGITFTNNTQARNTQYFFSQPFEDEAATLRVDFVGYGNTPDAITRETQYINVKGNENKNEIYIDQGTTVVSTKLTDKPIRVTAYLKEPIAAQPAMFFVITDKNGVDIETYPEGNVDVQGTLIDDLRIPIDPGEYVLKLMDDESHVYAQTYMKVVTIDITYAGILEEKPSTYIFDVKREGSKATLGQVTVKVDGGKYGTYQYQDVSRIEVNVGQYTGGQNLPIGDHVFEFTSVGLKLDSHISHQRRRTFFDEPLFWVVLILTLGIVGIGAIFARQETVYYFLDVPPFPPVARTKIGLNFETILSIFNKVNDNYRWTYTPLTSNEIKNGFKDIYYKGNPVYITDYNVDFLLEELERRGKLGSALNYYGLREWEEKTNHSMVYLALMRRLRDICVNNAIPFTSIDESKEADSVITIVGQQMYLHFFDKDADQKIFIKRVLATISKGITIVMFRSDWDKDKFNSLMVSSPSAAPLILKMEADNKSLLLLTSEELEEMLIEFKAM